MKPLDFTVLDKVVAQSGYSRVAGEVTKIELEEDWLNQSLGDNRVQQTIDVTIRLNERDSGIVLNTGVWTIVKMKDD